MGINIQLAKEDFKFSGTHFTILSSTEAERLHGHNYYVQISVQVKSVDPQLGMAFDFNRIKPHVRKICKSLDEYVLLPENSPFLKIEKNEKQIRIQFSNKHYSFPHEDVRLLPLVNITSEELARFISESLKPDLQIPQIESWEISVEETRGQKVTYWSKN